MIIPVKEGETMQLPEFTLAGCSSFYIHTDPRTAATPPTTKDSWATDYELRFFPEDWEGGICIDGTLYPARKGSFSCCKPGQMRHHVMPYRCYRLAFSTRDEQLQKALAALPPISHHPEAEQMLALCRKIIRVDQRSTLNARFESFGYACSLLSLLLRSDPEALDSAPTGNVRRHKQALLDADHHLRTHLEEEVDLVKLAADSHLHPTYFHKLFSAAYGRSPAQQLMQHRLNQARVYLHDDDRPIAEIARLCGFSSQSYFCRKFKELTTQTPSAYRCSLRKRRL